MNNKKSNLRKCTHGQNMFNRKLNSNNTSGFKGVVKNRGRWIAQIERRIKGKRKVFKIGRFNDKVEAARAYNKAALKYFGKFACLNNI